MVNQSSFELTASRGFTNWMTQQNCSIVFSTYQGGKVFLLGVSPTGALSISERNFPRCMGIAVTNSSRTIFLATHYNIFRLDNFLSLGETHNSFDAIYFPTQSWFTGDVDAHDVAMERSGSLVFANTAFNCVATLADGHSFRPRWLPPFVDRLAGEDRCHLNGIALDEGDLAYVTCISDSNSFDGWRDNKLDGGVVIDTRRGEVFASGLSMPHSPRFHNGRLWLLNSGTGEVGYIEASNCKFVPISFCPGYARGLSMIGQFAVIGLSKPRHGIIFGGLALESELARRKVQARCGLLVVDTLTGDVVEWIRIEGPISELYDVALLPGVRCPSAVGLKGSEIGRTVSIAE
jgi:uncharacterized protein (TIGR03032 family)